MVPLVLVLSLQGCALMKNFFVEPPVKSVAVEAPVQQVVVESAAAFHGVQEERIERNDFPVGKEDDVIGRLVFMRLGEGDTLPDVARHFSLGISEISAANPGVDMWVPVAEEGIVLPLSHILPEAPRKGIVINLASMRLFQFKGDGRSTTVSTYPVGVGTTERPSPTGPMYVRSKTVKPTWVVPVSISEDHRKKGDPLPPKVLPGPLNPLGEYALYLSKPSYLIHGTNKPYSIGLNATNGCIRLYPEDVKKLYGNVPVNTPVLILNQPYLVGQRNGVVYLEVHPSPGDRDPVEVEKMFAKLRNVERSRAEGSTGRKSRRLWPRPGVFPFPYPRSVRGVKERPQRL